MLSTQRLCSTYLILMILRTLSYNLNVCTIIHTIIHDCRTWEETDKSDWVKSKLESLLSTVTVKTGPDLHGNPELLLRYVVQNLCLHKALACL
jgi:hypothetical protein